MVLERWRPRLVRTYRPIRDIEEEMEHLMEHALARWPISVTLRRAASGENGWVPAMDVFEKEDSFVVRAELPGVKMEDLDISATGEVLTIKGERRPPEEVTEEDYHRCEICYGSFSRSIALPSTAIAGKAEAAFSDGILELRVPKVKEAKPSKIRVKTA
jgi:HSP20 family protein